MPINAVKSSDISLKKPPLLNLKNTGYVALGTMAGAMVTGMVTNKTLRKTHKYFSWIALVSSLAHLWIILSYRKKR